MSRTGITFEEVKKAIAEVQGRQKNPTVDAIREVLGTGSKSTIARYLREWKTQHGLGVNNDGRLPSDLLGIVNGLWGALQKKADERVDKHCQESDAKMSQMQQQCTKTKQQEANLRQNVHKLEEQLHQQTEEIRLLKARLTTEEQEKIRLTERGAALEVRCQEHKAENQQLHQLLEHVQENLEHYQTATQRLREEQSLIMEKHHQEYEQKLSHLLSQISTANNEQSVVQAKHDQLVKAHEVLVAEHKSLEKQYADVHAQHELLKVTQDKIQQEYDNQKQQNQAQSAKLATLQQTMAELRVTLKTKEDKIALLEEGFTKANDKIESLRDESQFVRQEKAGLEGQLKQMQGMLSSGKLRAAG